MSFPDYQSLMLPVLSASSKGEVRIGSVVDELANDLGLSPEERSEWLPSGQQTVFANRVHWAKSYLGKAGLIQITRRGYFRITVVGEDVLHAAPQKIDNKFLRWRGSFPSVAGSQANPGRVNAGCLRSDRNGAGS